MLIAKKAILFRKQKEQRILTGCFADAPAEKRIEFLPLFRLRRTRRLTFIVLTKVIIGIGASLADCSPSKN